MMIERAKATINAPENDGVQRIEMVSETDSRNLNAFDDKNSLMQNYLTLVKRHVTDDYAVIFINNPDITKPTSINLEALSEIGDGSTGAIT